MSSKSKLIACVAICLALTALGAYWLFERRPNASSGAIASLEELGATVHVTRYGKAKFVDLFAHRGIEKALPFVAELPELEMLALSGTTVTDEQMQVVAKLKKLKHLAINDTEVGDEGLKALAELSELEVLNLDDCPKFTDAGLANLSNHKSLQKIHMNHTGVTNAGIKHLLGLSNLQHLLAFDTKIDETGVAELKASVPEVTVIISPAAGSQASSDEPSNEGSDEPPPADEKEKAEPDSEAPPENQSPEENQTPKDPE